MTFEQKGSLTNSRGGLVGADVPFQRIRRITGYLTGSTESWNSAKIAELEDRTKHGLGGMR